MLVRKNMIMASSNKRITLLFILPAIFATVQSAAPCRDDHELDNCDSTPQGARVLARILLQIILAEESNIVYALCKHTIFLVFLMFLVHCIHI